MMCSHLYKKGSYVHTTKASNQGDVITVHYLDNSKLDIIKMDELKMTDYQHCIMVHLLHHGGIFFVWSIEISKKDAKDILNTQCLHFQTEMGI